MSAAPSMAEVLCKGVPDVECSHVPGRQPSCERDAQALAAAGFGHVASVEARIKSLTPMVSDEWPTTGEWLHRDDVLAALDGEATP